MNKSFGPILLAYGLVVAASGLLLTRLFPGGFLTAVVAAVVGGVLCGAWGMLVLAGKRTAALTILTLIPMNFVFLSQTVLSWWPAEGAPGAPRSVSLLITGLLLVSMGLLMKIAYGAAFAEGNPAARMTAAEQSKMPGSEGKLSPNAPTGRSEPGQRGLARPMSR